MKKFILTFAFVLSLGVFTSCSVDELEQTDNSQFDKKSNQKDPSNNTQKPMIGISLDSLSVNINFETEIDPPILVPKPQ